MRALPVKELIVRRWECSGRYESGIVVVRSISHGHFIAGWFPNFVGKNIACSAQILLQNNVPCWTWICALSSAMTWCVVQWEHCINMSRASSWLKMNCGDKNMNTAVIVEHRRPWHCSNKFLYAGLLAPYSLLRCWIMTASKRRLAHGNLENTLTESVSRGMKMRMIPNSMTSSIQRMWVFPASVCQITAQQLGCMGCSIR